MMIVETLNVTDSYAERYEGRYNCAGQQSLRLQCLACRRQRKEGLGNIPTKSNRKDSFAFSGWAYSHQEIGLKLEDLTSEYQRSVMKASLASAADLRESSRPHPLFPPARTASQRMFLRKTSTPRFSKASRKMSSASFRV